MPDFKLPDVGEGLTEAEIVTWKVKVGDVIKINDIVVEIETAKSLVELPSPYAGTVQALHVPEGETVPVGTPIITIGDGAAAPAPAAAPAAPARPTDSRPLPRARREGRCRLGGRRRDRHVQPGRDRRRREPDARRLRPADRGGPAPPPPRRREPVDRGRGRRAAAAPGRVRPGRPGDHRRVPADEPAVPATPAVPAPAAQAPAGDVRVLAKPPVRKLAKDLGVDLRTLTPTGPDGTVTREDVQAATAAPELSGAVEVAQATRRADRSSGRTGASRSRACAR